MTVKELISLLKRMPQNLQVGHADGDNSLWEISSWPRSVLLFDKADEEDMPAKGYLRKEEQENFDSLPDKVVVIRG